jgi:hypothetical protein
MNNIKDEEFTPGSGYTTPPLSPAKTVSTEGWMSPRTPVSPRKSRSHLFFHDIGEESFLSTPLDSPTKTKHSSRLGVLHSPDVPKFTPCLPSSPEEEDFPIKKRLEYLDGATADQFSPSSPLHGRFFPGEDLQLGRDSDQLSDDSPHQTSEDCTSPADPRDSNKQGPNVSSTIEIQSSSPPTPDNVTIDSDVDSLVRLTNTNTSDITASPTRLRQMPLRHASSPLRPSQWVTRGGLLSSPRNQPRTPDRFIPSRRPPNVTRESFEFSKPAERFTSANVSGIDPFSRRLRRSGRLNDELRSLRESHSVLTGRAHPNRRGANASLRHGTITTGTRHISAGAVWNVGGSSAVSDTVVGVSNGRGGMLGSGTNAPLYTSMFLSRSDPEAELEAYERRLALALDIDQTGRILEHSPSNNSPSTASSGSTPSPMGRTRHVWKDNAWTKDGVAPRSFRTPHSLTLMLT